MTTIADVKVRVVWLKNNVLFDRMLEVSFFFQPIPRIEDEIKEVKI